MWNSLRVSPQRLSIFKRASVQQGADVHSLESLAGKKVCSRVMDHGYMARPPAGMLCC